MSISIQAPQSQEDKLLSQKEKIKALYGLLQDIPEEKSLFESKKTALVSESFFNDPMNLKWMVLRIDHRIKEAKAVIVEAMTRSVDGVLDLSRKNLCDITIKDFHAHLPGIWKLNLSGNFFRTLPPFCAFKPYIEICEAVGNLADIEKQFYDFRRQNQVSIDLLNILKSLSVSRAENRDEYLALYNEVYENAAKASVIELAHRVHTYLGANPPILEAFKMSPELKPDYRIGGVRGFFSLLPFARLKVLDLSFCPLEHRAPLDWLSPLTQLRELDLSNTPLREVPHSLKGGIIERLKLGSTHILYVPAWLASMPSLIELDVSNTMIQNLPKNFETSGLEILKLDGCNIETFPSLPLNMREISIKRTQIKHVPFQFLHLLKRGGILIDDESEASIILQKQVARVFENRYLSQVVFKSELFKTKPDCAPRIIKTHLVGLEYLLLMLAWSLAGLVATVALPGPMLCSRAHNMRSRAFQQYRQEHGQLQASVCLLYFMYHFGMVQNFGKDIKTLGRYLRN